MIIITPAAAQDDRLDRYRRDQLLHNTVVIRALNGERWQLGFGVIFGRGGNIVWIATAAHLVFPNYVADQVKVGLAPAGRIEITRRDEANVWRTAGRPELTSVRDLALLPVALPIPETGADRWVEPSIDRDPAPGDPVHLTGYQATIDYFSRGATVTRVNVTGLPEVAALGGGPGQSGAGVVTERGYIGLYTQSAGQQFIPIRDLQRAALEAQRPWRLTDAPPRARATRLCLSVIGTAPSTIQVLGPTRLARPDVGGCVDTFSGVHKISSTSPWVFCRPDRIEVPADGAERVSLLCEPSLAGIWSSEAGPVEITKDAEDKWTLKEGLSQSPFGWIVGTLSGKPPSLLLDGRTQNGLHIGGFVHADGNRISGRVLVGGAAWRLELSR